MKHSITLAVVAFLIAALAGACIPQGVEAQAENRVVIRTDYEMLGFGSLHGGGHLTYELYGQAAGDLRRAVLATYDGLITATANGQIDPEELKMNEQTGYIAAIETLLANTQFFSGSTGRFDPLHEGQGEDITADAQGFVEVQNIASDETTPIRIYFYFDATSDFVGGFNLIASRFIDALYEPVIINTNLIHLNQYSFQYKHTDYRISMGSMYKPDLTDGSIFVARTPAGEVTTYNVVFDYDGTSASVPADAATYSPFHFLESPQVLFIMVFICCYLISYVPTKMYVNYKYAYPRKFRHRAKKILWLHIGNKLLILFLLLFYFFPTMFAFISHNFFINGIAMWILSIVMTVSIGAGAKILYDKKTAEIPQEYAAPTVMKVHKRPVPAQRQTTTTTPAGVNIIVGEAPRASAKESGPPCAVCKRPITDFADLTKCRCGQLYHEKCAEVTRTCKKCNKSLVDLPVAAPPPPPVPVAAKTKSIQCPTCGEMNKVPVDAELIRERCTSCKTILEDVKPGYNYLVVDSEPIVAYSMFVSIIKKGYSGLVISTTFPEKLKKEYDMSKCEIIWLTDTSVSNQKTLNPHRLEFEMMRMYSGFIKGNQKSAVILDGFEYLVVENGFDKVYKFIKKVNDLSSVHQATLVVPIGPSSLEPDQLGTLKKEFDEVVDITDDNGK